VLLAGLAVLLGFGNALGAKGRRPRAADLAAISAAASFVISADESTPVLQAVPREHPAVAFHSVVTNQIWGAAY
jgi:hypothetical protein